MKVHSLLLLAALGVSTRTHAQTRTSSLIITDGSNSITLQPPASGGASTLQLPSGGGSLLTSGSDLIATGGFRNTLAYFVKTVLLNTGSLHIHECSTPGGAKKVVMPYAGSLTAITFAVGSDVTGGSIGVEVYKNGLPTGLSAVITSGQTAYTVQAKDVDTFAAGDYLGVTLTKSADYVGPHNSDVTISVIGEF